MKYILLLPLVSYLNTCRLDSALLSCKFSHQDMQSFFVQEGIVSGFLKTCCTCLHWDANQAPGTEVLGLFFNFLYEDLHSVNAKSWMVLWVKHKWEILDRVLYDMFS